MLSQQEAFELFLANNINLAGKLQNFVNNQSFEATISKVKEKETVDPLLQMNQNELLNHIVKQLEKIKFHLDQVHAEKEPNLALTSLVISINGKNTSGCSLDVNTDLRC